MTTETTQYQFSPEELEAFSKSREATMYLEWEEQMKESFDDPQPGAELPTLSELDGRAALAALQQSGADEKLTQRFIAAAEQMTAANERFQSEYPADHDPEQVADAWFHLADAVADVAAKLTAVAAGTDSEIVKRYARLAHRLAGHQHSYAEDLANAIYDDSEQ